MSRLDKEIPCFLLAYTIGGLGMSMIVTVLVDGLMFTMQLAGSLVPDSPFVTVSRHEMAGLQTKTSHGEHE